MSENHVYIGDGVYVEFKDYGDVILKANNHINPTDIVVLEPQVLLSFIALLKDRGIIE